MARQKARLPLRLSLRSGALLGALAGAAYSVWLRPRMLTWGAAPDEINTALPGDEMISNPALVITRAVTISAPVEAVWPFVAQLGRGGTGWYAYDAFDNGGAPSYEIARRDLPAPVPGMAMDRGFTIAYVESPRALVFTGALTTDLVAPSWGSYAYVLNAHAHGTRLVVRVRTTVDDVVGRAQLVAAFEPIDFLMTVKQLNGIKQCAERFAAHQMNQSRPPDGLIVPYKFAV